MFLDGSDLRKKKKRKCLGNWVKGNRELQFEPSEVVLNGLNVLSEYHVGYTHRALKKLSVG